MLGFASSPQSTKTKANPSPPSLFQREGVKSPTLKKGVGVAGGIYTKMMKDKPIGLGSHKSNINFYIASRPPIDDYPMMPELRGLAAGELDHIVKHTSNHWRKAFNVYAKLLFDWYRLQNRKDLPNSWQSYRDGELFQAHSQETLLFSPPQLTPGNGSIHIIAGKTYAGDLDLPPLIWLDNYFAINQKHRLVVAPYPDYRQLSNERIGRLIDLMKSFNNPA